MKACNKCGDPKKLSDFGKKRSNKDGHRSECKLCCAEQAKEWRETNKERTKEYYEANKERVAERGKKYYEANKGRIAEQAKEYYEANKERIKKYCEASKSRIAERGKEWREANKERVAERGKEWREANKERCVEQSKEWRKANKERVAEQGKKWAKANPDKRRSKSARRRSVKLQAHPPWAATLEKRQIEGIYTLAKIQEEETGKEYHVDHIHPLQAPKVVMFEGEMIPLICGLHVPANLQILEASVNLSKHNKFEPYIESECDFTEPWQVRSDDRTLIPNPIDRIPRRYPRAFIKPRKSKGMPKGQLSLF